MAEPEVTTEAGWVERMGRSRPDVVLMGPYMAYLVLLALNGRVPEAYMGWMIGLRGVGALAVVWVFRRHFPPMGRAHAGIALGAGVLAAVLWVAGQHAFDAVGLGGRLFVFPGQVDAEDPRAGLSPLAWWSQAVTRIAVASTTVAIVEEIFWRAFLLRALIDWQRFDLVPLGTFTWVSFLGTSLLSTLQHPDNWAVSIPCWFLYNGLFYWKRSLTCNIIAHGVTNLVLYVYVIRVGAWQFW